MMYSNTYLLIYPSVISLDLEETVILDKLIRFLQTIPLRLTTISLIISITVSTNFVYVHELAYRLFLIFWFRINSSRPEKILNGTHI